MSTPKLTRKIQANISLAESIFWDGLGFTRGRFRGKLYTVEEDASKRKGSGIALVRAYRAYKELHEEHSLPLKRMHTLARHLMPAGRERYADYVFGYYKTPEDVQIQVAELAEVGRALAKSPETSDETRISSGRLFWFFNQLYAAQIPTPERGCSSSICSNCHEPVAFCDYICPSCGMEFIGPFGMPKVDDWQKLRLHQKRAYATSVYFGSNQGQLCRAN